MLGLIVLGFLAIYLLVSVFVVRATVHYARRTGRNPRWWGLIACLVMYNLLFWEVLPTVVANEYYCSTTAGFKVYKTVEQWRRDNPGVSETLTWRDLAKSYTLQDGSTRYVLNERFYWVTRQKKALPVLSTTTSTEVIVDRLNAEILAEIISVGYGHGSPMLGGGWRVVDWFDLKRCSPGRGEFVEIRNAVKKLGSRVEG